MVGNPGDHIIRLFEGGALEDRVLKDTSLEEGTRIICLDNITVMPATGDPEQRFNLKNAQAQRVIDAVDLPEYQLTWRDALQTIRFMFQNTFDTQTHTCRDYVKAMREAQFSGVHKGDNVLLFFHGYHQNAGSATQLHHDAEKFGMKVVGIDYNFRMAPEEFAETVLHKAQQEVLDRGAKGVVVLGHSTGADNIRYSLIHDPNVLDQATDQGIKYIMSAPLTSGLRGRLNWAQHSMAPLMPKRDKMWTPEGERQFLALNQPLPKEADTYTFLCASDMLVTPECGLDTNNNATNVVIPYGGHFEGTGISRRVNLQYLNLALNGIPGPK
jgi:hypothetical protein